MGSRVSAKVEQRRIQMTTIAIWHFSESPGKVWKRIDLFEQTAEESKTQHWQMDVLKRMEAKGLISIVDNKTRFNTGYVCKVSGAEMKALSKDSVAISQLIWPTQEPVVEAPEPESEVDAVPYYGVGPAAPATDPMSELLKAIPNILQVMTENYVAIRLHLETLDKKMNKLLKSLGEES